MNIHTIYHESADLMPPDFGEGLDDWSHGDGSPASGSYDSAANARLVGDDPDFGTCLELRTTSPMQRLRYRGEVPVRTGHYLEISARLKAMQGQLPLVRVSAFAGGRRGQRVDGVPEFGPVVALGAHRTVFEVSAVIGPEMRRGVHLVWSAAVSFAHAGIDILSEGGSVVRIDRVAVRGVTRRYAPLGPVLPGFTDL